MRYFLFFWCTFAFACTSDPSPNQNPTNTVKEAPPPAQQPAPTPTEQPPSTAPEVPKPAPKTAAAPKNFDKPAQSEPGSGFTRVRDLASDIRLDIRYATTNNFTKAQIYDCPECLLRPGAARALVKVHRALQDQGFGGLKMFDCYRPRPYQQRLWDKVPNPDYVTPPAKGSMHSRGAAVDLTIVDKTGKELDMGTPYDFFGKEAHYDYTQLPQTVLDNRKLLRTAMEKQGFEGIRTEWWHFSFRSGKFDLSDYLWNCE